MDTTIPSTATDCLEEREPFTEQYNATTARTTLSTNHALAFPKKSAIIARINPTHASLACSFETQTLLDKKVVELVKRQHEKALQILQDNIGKLHELAKYLYEHETITGDEFMKILEAPEETPAAVTEE